MGLRRGFGRGNRTTRTRQSTGRQPVRDSTVESHGTYAHEDTTISMDFISQLQHSTVMDWVRESGSLWGYPAILFLHTMGLAIVAGLNGAIDLRLLGAASRVPLSSLTRFFPFIWVAFG